MTVPYGSCDFIVSKGTDRLAGNTRNRGYDKTVSHSQIQGKILTDLSIYRPGDTIGFMGVVYEVKEREMRQLPGTEVKLVLCDANY